MANLKKSSLRATLPIGKPMNYDDLLRRARQQTILARQMIEKAKQMTDSAVAMRSRPCVVLLP